MKSRFSAAVRCLAPPLETRVRGLSADQAFERRDPGLVGVDQVGGVRLIVERAGLVLLEPDANQSAGNVMAFRQTMQGLAGQILLYDLALELDTVTPVRGHGLSLSENPVGQVKFFGRACPPSGAHSTELLDCGPALTPPAPSDPAAALVPARAEAEAEQVRACLQVVPRRVGRSRVRQARFSSRGSVGLDPNVCQRRQCADSRGSDGFGELGLMTTRELAAAWGTSEELLSRWCWMELLPVVCTATGWQIKSSLLIPKHDDPEMDAGGWH